MDSKTTITHEVASSSAKKRYKLVSKSWSRNYDFIADDGSSAKGSHRGKTPLFVVDTSNFTPRKPDVTLHTGSDTSSSSPAVACCYIPAMGRTFRVGLGDVVGSPGVMRWEEMKQSSLLTMKHFGWSMDLPGGERPELMWKRTTRVAVDGKTASSLSSRNWKLVRLSSAEEAEEIMENAVDSDSIDDEIEDDKRRAAAQLPSRPKGDVLAVFTSEVGLTHVCGTLQINVEWGPDFDRMVLVTLTAVYEKLKRARQSSSGGGGGGGGG